MEYLKDKYKDYFYIGAAVNNNTIVNEGEIIKDHFNSVTCENQMKYGFMYRNGAYNYAPADEIYDFAKKNGILMRGHNFVWHNQTPYELFEKSADEVEEALVKHINLMNERYGDIIYSWDVVNEAIEDKTDGYLRRSVWQDKFGTDYIKKIFKLAKDNLPDNVSRVYNDYNEYVPEKREKIIRMIKEVNAEEKLITGIGFQSHVNLYYPDLDLYRETFEEYIKLGLKISVTELDLSLFEFNDKTKLDAPTPELEEKFSKVYGDLFAIYREYKDHIESVTLWGVSDRYTWLDHFPVRDRKNWPLLFDVDGNPKEAFYRVMDF